MRSSLSESFSLASHSLPAGLPQIYHFGKWYHLMAPRVSAPGKQIRAVTLRMSLSRFWTLLCDLSSLEIPQKSMKGIGFPGLCCSMDRRADIQAPAMLGLKLEASNSFELFLCVPYNSSFRAS